MVKYECVADITSKMHARASAYISKTVDEIRINYHWDNEFVEYETKLIRISENPYKTNNEANASQIMSIQNMFIQPNDRIQVVVEGEDKISDELEQLCYDICEFLEGDLENYHRPE